MVPQGDESDDFGSFLEDLTVSLEETVVAKEEPWRKELRKTIDAAEREGFVVERIRALDVDDKPADFEAQLGRYVEEIQRLREIEEELDRLKNPWPEAAQGLLKDPDRLEEAETLLTSVEERQRPFPRLGPGPKLGELRDFAAMAVRAADQLVTAEKPEYNPLYMWSGTPELVRTVLGATGRTYQAASPEGRMAVTSVQDFAQDFIRALGQGVAGAWRERWWTVDLLLVHGVEALSETERAQDEFFHLFEALKRRGARILLAADRAPAGIGNIDERLRSRFEGGLVVEVKDGSGADLTLVDETDAPEEPKKGAEAPLWDEEPAAPAPTPSAPAAEAKPAAPQPQASKPAPPKEAPAKEKGGWFPSRENIVLHWPELDRLLIEELE